MNHFLKVLSFLTICLFFSCDDCDDCKDLQQKNVLVEDATGSNLLFGNGAAFDPEEATIETSSGIQQLFFIDEATQTLQFFLEENETTYTIRLDSETSEILTFDLSERDSERCCGTQTFSTSTRLNGTSIDNSNTITIIK